MKQLIALNEKNKQNRVLCSILQFQNLLENFIRSKKFHF